MTKLKQFLDKNGIKYARFAELVGTSKATLHGIISGIRLPGLDIALEIEKKTGGAITPYDYEIKVKEKAIKKTKKSKTKANAKTNLTSA